jgi:hypothetical protein
VGSYEPDRVNVSHLLFVDDTLIFSRATADQIHHIGALLVCFKAVAGLKVNLSKSALVPVGPLDNVGQLTGLLGCGAGEVPLKYLGLPLRASFKLKAMWAGLEDLMARQLTPRKRLYLSKGGKITFIKSTLSNMPTYIKNMRQFNQALLGKWLWRFAHEEGAWWRSVLVAKYGSVWGGWRLGVIFGSHGVGLWKFICMGWQNFRRFLKFDPSEGSKICFWDDVWCGDRTLKEAFFRLFQHC